MSHKPTHPIYPCRHSPTNSYFSPQVFYHHPPQHYTHLSFTSFPPCQHSSSYLPKHQMVPLICLTSSFYYAHIYWAHICQTLCPKQTLHLIVYHNVFSKLWAAYPLNHNLFPASSFTQPASITSPFLLTNWFATLNTFPFCPYPTNLHKISASMHSLPCR